MKTPDIIKFYALLMPGLILSTAATFAKAETIHYANDTEDCVRALNDLTIKAEKDCGAISTTDLKVLRSLCFCAPIQGNNASGQCGTGDDSEFNVFTDNHNAFFELDANGCFSDRYIEKAKSPVSSTTQPINFCSVKFSSPSIKQTNKAWTHKSEFIADNGTTKITMESLRDRLAKAASKLTCRNKITVIDESTNLKDNSAASNNKLYVTKNANLTISKELNLGNGDEPPIIFGTNITISGPTNQQKKAHVLASGTLNVSNGNKFIGGLNAHKLNYYYTSSNTEQRIITTKEYSNGTCSHCADMQHYGGNQFRLTQISGSNACEQVILQLEECTSNNSDCSPYTGTEAVITANIGGKSVNVTPDAAGRVYLSNSTFNGAFSASLGVNNQSTKMYCSTSDTTTNGSCGFTGATCKASISHDINGYVGENIPLVITLPGNALSAFRALGDTSDNNTGSIIKIIAGISTTQKLSITGANSTTTVLNIPESENTASGEFELPNAAISYDATTDKTNIKTSLIVNTLALDNTTQNTLLNYLKLEVIGAILAPGETEDTTPKTEFYLDLTTDDNPPKIRTAPVAFCVKIDNGDNQSPYVLESDRNYSWKQWAVGCTKDYCLSTKAPVKQDLVASQLELAQLCIGTGNELPISEVTAWQNSMALEPLYKSTFAAWTQAPSSTTVKPDNLALEDATLTKAYEPIDVLTNDNSRLALGFTGTNGSGSTVHFTDSGWISFSSYPTINTISNRKTYFYSPVYTVIPTYLYPEDADIYNYYLLTDAEDINTVPQDLTPFEMLNNDVCPQYYNEHFLLRVSLHGRSATDRIQKNVRGALVDNSKNLVDFTGFSLLSSDEDKVKGTAPIARMTEELNLQKQAVRTGNWESLLEADQSVNSAVMTADEKFSLPGVNASPKNVFLAVVGRTYLCEAPQAAAGSFDCDLPVYTQNTNTLPADDTLVTQALANELKNYYGLSALPTITDVAANVSGLKQPSLWKNVYTTFLHLTDHSGPVLKNVASGRLVSLPVTGTTDTLYMPFTVQALDATGNWKVRQDSCTTLNLTDTLYGGRTLVPSMFFKTSLKDRDLTDKNGILKPQAGEEVKLAFCGGTKNTCNSTTGNFGAGVLWLEAKHKTGAYNKNSYGLINFKFNPGTTDNKSIEHLLDETTSQGGFFFKRVKNNLRIISESVE